MKIKMSKRQKRILIAKAIKQSINAMTFFGVFTLYGSLGALEVERIGFQQFIVQCIIGLAIVLFSRYAHYKIYEEEVEYV